MIEVRDNLDSSSHVMIGADVGGESVRPSWWPHDMVNDVLWLNDPIHTDLAECHFMVRRYAASSILSPRFICWSSRKMMSLRILNIPSPRPQSLLTSHQGHRETCSIRARNNL